MQILDEYLGIKKQKKLVTFVTATSQKDYLFIHKIMQTLGYAAKILICWRAIFYAVNIKNHLLKIKYPNHINKFKVVGSPSIDFKKNKFSTRLILKEI